MFGKCIVIINGKFFPFVMTVGNSENFRSSRWYKISLWSVEIQMHLRQERSSRRSCSIKVGVLKTSQYLHKISWCWSLSLTEFNYTSVFWWILRSFKNPFLEDNLLWLGIPRNILGHANNICCLFLEKCQRELFLIFSKGLLISPILSFFISN